MRRVRIPAAKRVMAALLAAALVLSVVPMHVPVYAATGETPDAVTVTVVDEAGAPVRDAAVNYSVFSSVESETIPGGAGVTDQYGTVQVMPAAQFATYTGALTLYVTVKAEGYLDGTLEAAPIQSGTDNFQVRLISTTIDDVTITGNVLTYTGEQQELVTVTQVEGDRVSYELVEGPEGYELEYRDGKPVAVDVGTYGIQVTVEREGKEPLIQTVTAQIQKASIQGIAIHSQTLTYNGREQALVTLDGRLQREDAVTWTVNGQPTGSTAIPTATAAGRYEVTLTVSRANHADFTQTVNTEIAAGVLEELEGLTVTGLDGVYMVDGSGAVAQELVAVENTGGYTLMYQVDRGSGEPVDGAWQAAIPTAAHAGAYKVWVKVGKENYQDKLLEVAANIAKADQSFRFDEHEPHQSEAERSQVQLSGSVPYQKDNTYNFRATDTQKLVAGSTITYAVECEEGVATIDGFGVLTVSYPGDITVVATLSGNENYNPCEIRYYLGVSGQVSTQGDYISFAQGQVDYILGVSNQISAQKASKRSVWIMGDVTYSMEPVPGVDIDARSGAVTVADYEAFAAAMREAGGTLDFTVTATKEKMWFYGRDTASYIVRASFEITPKVPYTLPKVDGDNGWYATDVVVTPAVGYTIAQSAAGTFAPTTTLSDQGTGTRYVYLKNSVTGGVTDRIPLEIKIDTQAPDTEKMSMEIQELNFVEQVGAMLKIFNPSVTIRFAVEDELEEDESGLAYLEWFYTASEDATSSILPEKSGRLEVEKESGRYVATLEVTATEAEQYRGHIAFQAVDLAGKTSDRVKEDGVVIVVDTIHPTMSASFQLADPDGVYRPVDREGVVQHYFNGDVAFTFTIKEANFYQEDVEIQVEKDGDAHQVEVAWTRDETQDEVHHGTFTLSEDGDYVVTMRYQDSAANGMVDEAGAQVEQYTSEVITVDTTQPELEMRYVHRGEIQKTIFTVTERNFSPQHIVVAEKSTMQDITGKDLEMNAAKLTQILQTAQWEQDGDTYTFEYDGYADGIYHLFLDYTDAAWWQAEQFEAEPFVVDHEGPTGVKVEYAKSPVDQFLEMITLGFYNPAVTVRFTAVDTSAGVESFTWEYTKEDGASDIGHPDAIRPTTLAAQQDKTDKSRFTAEMTLTADQANQYRGYLSVVATDAYDNRSDKKVDSGNIIVVDTISPQMTVEYSPADRTEEDTRTYYYNRDVQVRFTVTEANFYPEDVQVSVTRNGSAFDCGPVAWGTRDAQDRTVGTLTLKGPADHSGDGDYVITVACADRSDNQMATYVSDTHSIDTTAPVIRVDYQNTAVVNTLKDRYNQDRRYFADTQTAVVTIQEHNFRAEDVQYNITAQDVAGNALDLGGLVSQSQWSSQGDVHTMTITYHGDANYTFDVAYTDLATNAAAGYPTDHFTVDKTAPENLQVKYSASVLDTVLQAVSFGFYNAPMTVTISAEDPVSGVHAFLYSCLDAEGGSGAHAQLVDQTIGEGDIRYSNDGATATASFDIPRGMLNRDSQFNGTVAFAATDRAGRKSDVRREDRRIVVDNIAPNAQVTYNDPVYQDEGIAYYDGNIQASIAIQEANFFPEDVQVLVSLNGGSATEVPTTWTHNGGDSHTGAFTLSGDGDYLVTIHYRDKSYNQMESYTSQQMTIDTQLEDPVLRINGHRVGQSGGAYKGDADIDFAFDDVNFHTQTVQLVRTRFGAVEDVTQEFIRVQSTQTGGAGAFSIPSEPENDGVYTLTVEMTDKAQHTAQVQTKFTINRFGSVYEYGDYLMSLIQDGGQHLTIQKGESAAITEDLIITEYNADRLIEGSLRLLITRDGQPVDAAYTTNPAVMDETAQVGASGWYQYVYTIKASNFSQDGVYKIALSSAYATTDSQQNESTSVPENSVDANGGQVMDTMTFTVDTKAPEIRNIVNLEREIINARSVDVKYTVVDVGGLKSVEVLVDGETVDTVTQFPQGGYQYSGQFTIQERANAQTVQLKVTDLAGNVTDTASEEFNANELFVFCDTVTVSTNFFVRWYANKPLFWGCVAAAMAVVGAGCGIAIARGKKKAESK